ncbi:MAG: hypothetical protein ABI210_08275, partial [Abditibacteriaceae bacterium]
MRKDQHTTTRRMRRHIQLALAGAALGTVGIALPSYALPSTVNVTNTNSSGVGSFSQAISDANLAATSNTVVFSVPQGSTFPSGLPSITNQLTIDNTTITGTSALNSFTVNGGLTTDTNNGRLDLYGDGTASTINSNLTAKGSSYIDVEDYIVNGNLAADGEDSNGNTSNFDVSNSTINGAT